MCNFNNSRLLCSIDICIKWHLFFFYFRSSIIPNAKYCKILFDDGAHNLTHVFRLKVLNVKWHVRHSGVRWNQYFVARDTYTVNIPLILPNVLFKVLIDSRTHFYQSRKYLIISQTLSVIKNIKLRWKFHVTNIRAFLKLWQPLREHMFAPD